MPTRTDSPCDICTPLFADCAFDSMGGSSSTVQVLQASAVLHNCTFSNLEQRSSFVQLHAPTGDYVLDGVVAVWKNVSSIIVQVKSSSGLLCPYNTIQQSTHAFIHAANVLVVRIHVCRRERGEAYA